MILNTTLRCRRTDARSETSVRVRPAHTARRRGSPRVGGFPRGAVHLIPDQRHLSSPALPEGRNGDTERKGLTLPKRPLAYLPTTPQAFNAINAKAVPALAIWCSPSARTERVNQHPEARWWVIERYRRPQEPGRMVQAWPWNPAQVSLQSRQPILDGIGFGVRVGACPVPGRKRGRKRGYS
jgi:hypothetical protein